MDSNWSLDELRSVAQHAVARTSGRRVARTVTERTIRYYTTLGLVDRPVGVRGRLALYGRRHLLQIATLKRLQAEGVSLGEMVRRKMLKVSIAELERLAGVRAADEPRELHLAEERAGYGARPIAMAQIGRSPANDAESTVRLVQQLFLAPGLVVLLTATRPVGEAELDELRQSARPLVKTLERLGLVEHEKRSARRR